ncbi:hypothetical protein [Arthrobacter sp. UYCu712]|uniref:hypothetical protein n=1 Tax=Arthrobacter sp. UYCu712 TaxID=3156340 RepID=UPI00339440EF
MVLPVSKAGQHLHPNNIMLQLGSVALELLSAGTTAMDEHFCVTPPPLVANSLRHSRQAESGAIW